MERILKVDLYDKDDYFYRNKVTLHGKDGKLGYHRNKSVINDFNEQNSVQEPEISLNLQASQNGIGLALNF